MKKDQLTYTEFKLVFFLFWLVISKRTEKYSFGAVMKNTKSGGETKQNFVWFRIWLVTISNLWTKYLGVADAC